MSNGPVFISHATSDDAFVRELRLALEGLHIPVWVDSRNLRGGNALVAIEVAIALAVSWKPLVTSKPTAVITTMTRSTELCTPK